MIQYTKNEEARRAISSTEAVLNNRFIHVYWHREPGTAGTQQQDQSSGGQAAISSASPGTQHSSAHMVGVESKCRSPFLIDDIVSLCFGNTSFTCFPLFLVSAGDQAAQPSCLCVKQNRTQASPASSIWEHIYNQDGQLEPKHRHSHCTFSMLCLFVSGERVIRHLISLAVVA